MPGVAEKTRRLSKKDWLQFALTVAYTEGDKEIRIHRLCQRLRVTKGSFYAHFSSRADFITQLVDFWKEQFTDQVAVALSTMQNEPADKRLMSLMRILHRRRRGSLDVTFRSWAAHNEIVAKGVKEVDLVRYNSVNAIFHEIGFRGSELDTRTRVFVTYESSMSSMQLPPSGYNWEEEIKLRHAFFIK